MKKQIRKTLAFLTAASMALTGLGSELMAAGGISLAVIASAEVVTVDELKYELNDTDLTATVTGLDAVGVVSELAIPDTVVSGGKTYKVTAIADNAFEYYGDLASVTIGNNVKKIGRWAFNGCYSLTSVELPASLESIGDGSFASCGFTAIDLPSSLTSMGSCAFNGCSSLTSVVIPPLITVLESNVFGNCEVLESVSIPDSVIEIFSAFIDCPLLSSVEIPDSVTTIGGSAFERCTSLTSVTIPNSVTTIDGYAFSGCTQLTSVQLSKSIKTIGYGAFYGCSALASLDVYDLAEDIYGDAFNGTADGFTLHVVPDSYAQTYAVDNGILYEADLSSVKCTQSFNTVDTNGYDVTYELTAALLDDSAVITAFEVTSEMSYNTFSVTVPDTIGGKTVTKIGDDAFSSSYPYYRNGADYIDSVTLPDTVESIGKKAFSGCYNMKSFYFPTSLKEIGDGAFSSSGLKFLELPDSLEKIDMNAFTSCRIRGGVIIPEAVKSVGANAFTSNYISHAYFAGENTVIGDYAFDNGLTFVLSGKSGSTAETYAANNQIEFAVGEEAPVTGVDNGIAYVLLGDYAMVTGYTVPVDTDSHEIELTVPAAIGGSPVEVIADNAFYIMNLKTITLPDCVRIIGNSAMYNSATVMTNIPSSIEKIGANAYSRTAMPKEVVLPETLAYLSDNAFSYASYLRAITFPNSLTEIPNYVCSGIDSLTSVAFGDSVTSIGTRAFYDTGLLSVTIPASVTTINHNAFAYSPSLKFAYVPSTVTSVNSSFNYCDALTLYTNEGGETSAIKTYADDNDIPIVVGGDMPQIIIDENFNYVLYDDHSEVLKYIGDESAETIVVPDSIQGKPVTSIGAMTFYRNTNVKTITLPATLTEIGEYAFGYCSKLEACVIPNSVTTIGEGAFEECGKLNVNIPTSLTTVGAGAFAYSGITSAVIPDTVRGVLPEGVFAGCCRLESLTLGKNITEISARVIEDTKVSMLKIPSKVTIISNNAFSSSNLKYIYVPSCVIESGSDIFNSGTVVIGAADSYIATQAANEGNRFIVGTDLPAVGTYGEFGYVQFTDFVELTTFDFASNGDNRTVTIPEKINGINVTALCANLFSNKGNSTDTIVFEKAANITSIGDYCFNYSKMQGIIVPPNVVTIGERAYYGSSLSGELSIPTSVTALGASAFNSCSGITSAIVPAQITAIPSGLFRNCTDLYKLDLKGNVTEIGSYSFENTKLISCALPASVVSIGYCAFEDCAALRSVKISENTTSIDTYAFSSRSQLTIYCKQGSTADTYAQESGIPHSYGEMPMVYEDGGLLYEVADNKALILAYVGDKEATSITVPATLSGAAVTEIGNSVFRNLTELTAITLPDTITSIGSYAFAEDIALNITALPTALTTLGEYAFSNCFAITEMTLPEDLTVIPEGAFYSCNGIESVVLGSKVTEIGSNAFSGTKITEIALPSTLQKIRYNAFSDCTLIDIVIPEGVTTIESGAFDNSTLYAIQLPTTYVYSNSIGSIPVVYCAEDNENARQAALDCNAEFRIGAKPALCRNDSFLYYKLSDKIELIKFIGSESRVTIPAKIDNLPIKEITKDLFKYNGNISEVTIPEGMTTIEDYAFYGCSSLVKVTFPSTLKTIGDSAFGGCYLLKLTELPASVVSVGEEAFCNCSSIRTMTLGSMTIGCNVFTSLRELTIDGNITVCEDNLSPFKSGIEVTFTDKATAIDKYLFSNASPSKVTFSSTITSIGDYAFNGYYYEYITIPDTVTTFGEKIFGDINEVDVYGSATAPAKAYCEANGYNYIVGEEPYDKEMGAYTVRFYHVTDTCKIVSYSSDVFVKDLTVPASFGGVPVTAIGDGAFHSSYWGNEQTITLPETITEIGDYAFNDYPYLFDINLPAGLTKIGEAAFRNTMLSYVAIPSGVTEIADETFYSCEKLITVKLHDGITRIGYNAFADCYSLLFMTLPENESIDVDTNAFGSRWDHKSVTLYAASETSYTYTYGESNDIPHVVGATPELYMDGGITYVLYADHAIVVCADSEIETANITKVKNLDVTEIFNSAFAECEMLTTLTLPASLTAIGNGAFRSCSALTSVTIPGSVGIVSDESFYGCTALETVVISDGTTEIQSDAFRACTALTSLTIADSVETIGTDAFSDCQLLKTLVLPSSLGTIHSSAFINNKLTSLSISALNENLKVIDNVLYTKDGKTLIFAANGAIKGSFTVPEGVEDIRSYAFYNCTTLTDIQFPSTLNCIANSAFYGTGLTSLVIPNSVIQIGSSAFSYCTNLLELRIGTGVTALGFDIFSNCGKLRVATIPANVTTINSSAFRNSTTYLNVFGSVGSKAQEGCNNNNIRFKTCAAPAVITSGNFLAFEYSDSIAIYGLDDRYVTECVIPDTINSKPVTEIEPYTFASCRSMTSVTIPETVTYIGANAFYNCRGLQSVTIPEGVTEILPYTFAYCVRMTSAVIPATVKKIGNYAFYKNISLETATLPEGLESVGYYAFGHCSVYDSTLPSTLKSIGDCAFQNASIGSAVLPAGLETIGIHAFAWSNIGGTVALPETLTSVGNLAFAAFEDCTRITGVTIPAAYTIEGVRDIFDGCTGITAYTAAEDNTVYKTVDGVLYSKDMTKLYSYPGDKAKAASFAIPSTVTEIGNKSFFFADITTLTIPATVTAIDESAFEGFRGTSVVINAPITRLSDGAFSYSDVTTVTLPDTLKEIGGSAFSDSELTTITLPTSLETIYSSAFSYCTKLTSIEIPDSVTTISYGAFAHCQALTTVKLSAALTELSSYLFSYCRALTSVEIPDSVEIIGNEAFYCCSKLESVKLPASLKSIDSNAFSYDYALKTIELPDTVVSIGQGAFSYCEALTSVKLSASLADVGANAFYGCSALTTVTIPEGVTQIGDTMFKRCNKLNNVVLPSTITSIGSYAFVDCDSLTEITIPSGVELSDNLSLSVFEACRSLAKVVIAEGVTVIPEFTFLNCISLTSVTLPETLTEIDEWAFAFDGDIDVFDDGGDIDVFDDGFDRPVIAEFKIPASVTTIAGSAFSGNMVKEYKVGAGNESFSVKDGVLFNKDQTVLVSYPGGKEATTYTIPSTVKEIAPYAFCYNSVLESVVIPEGVEKIGGNAFANTVITSIAIPASVTDIVTSDSEQSFGYMYSLTSFTVAAGNTKYKAQDNVLLSKDGKTVLHYPLCSAETVTIPAGVTTIGARAFKNCCLMQVTIPETVTSIDIYAFAYNYRLSELTIPSSVETINNDVFVGCNNLKSVTFNEGLREIGGYAFLGCGSLESVTFPSTLETIGYQAFDYCSSLSSVKFVNGLTTIRNRAFYNTALKGAVLPETVMYLGSNAFKAVDVDDASQDDEYVGLNYLYVPASIADAALSMFDGEELNFYDYSEYLEAPVFVLYGVRGSSIEKLSESATRSIDFVPALPMGSFTLDGITYESYDNGVTAVVTAISPALTALTIPETVTSGGKTMKVTTIASSVKCNDTLTSINLPASVTDIAIQLTGFTKLAMIAVDGDNTAYTVIDNVLYSKDKKILYSAASTVAGAFVIPDGVVKVAAYAFTGSGVTTMTIPASTTNIEKNAFYGAREITGYYAHANNTVFQTLAGVLYNYGFYGLVMMPANKVITSFEIPATVSYVYDDAFCNSYITTLRIPGKETDVSVDAFDYINSELVIHVVPGSSAENSLKGYSWLTVVSDLTAQVNVGDSFEFEVVGGNITITKYKGSETAISVPSFIQGMPVTAIAAGAFVGSAATVVSLPKSVTSIAAGAFSNTTTVNEIVPPAGLGNLSASRNGDDEINSNDALLILKFSVTIEELSDIELMAGDVNGDGKVNSTDALIVLKYSVNIINDLAENYKLS